MDTADIVAKLDLVTEQIRFGYLPAASRTLADLRSEITADHYVAMAKEAAAKPTVQRLAGDLRVGDVVVGVWDAEPHRIAELGGIDSQVELIPDPFPGWFVAHMYTTTMVRAVRSDRKAVGHADTFDAAFADHTAGFRTVAGI